MDYIQENLVEVFLIVGFVLLGVEILILGFATFILLYVGIAAVLTGILMYSGLIEQSLNQGILFTGVLTAVLAAGSWRKLREIQLQSETKKATSDLIGMTFTLEQEVSPQSDTQFRYSGVQWLLKSDSTIQQGAKVKVIDVEVGVMHITIADD
ncbi:MAG: NfeD family protein [Aestuariibacter sp.]